MDKQTAIDTLISLRNLHTGYADAISISLEALSGDLAATLYDEVVAEKKAQDIKLSDTEAALSVAIAENVALEEQLASKEPTNEIPLPI